MDETSEITPDSYMDRPIGSLLWGAAMLVYRVNQMSRMDRELLNNPIAQKILDVDEQMRVAYLASIKLRASEVCSFARSLGYQFDPDTVKCDPFGVAIIVFPQDQEMNHADD